ncbi:MAG TPA: Spy/CpxP family protein refolding chaperone [Thermoanaerobaculia bacterium]|nr:Spy/CpxP family protein refolding chaperone [Thermoanaerobaculia bacterium]
MSIQQIRRSVLIAAAVAALAFSGLFAGRIFGRQMGQGQSFTHGPRAAKMFDHIASELDLTDAQRGQIRGVLKAHADEILAQVKAGMIARRALHDAVISTTADEATIRGLAAQVGAVHGDGALLIVRVRSEIWPILTPAQQEKFVAFHNKMGQRGDEALDSLGTFLRGEN